jgi:hypothetical protein
MNAWPTLKFASKIFKEKEAKTGRTCTTVATTNYVEPANS